MAHPWPPALQKANRGPTTALRLTNVRFPRREVLHQGQRPEGGLAGGNTTSAALTGWRFLPQLTSCDQSRQANRPTGFSRCYALATGSASTNVEPAPNSLTTASSPPIRTTSACEIARPRPTPGARAVSVLR